MNLEEKKVENRSIRCVGCLYWDWNRYHSMRKGDDKDKYADFYEQLIDMAD